MTLLLSRRDISGLMSQGDWLAVAETAFRAAAEGRADCPPPMHIAAHGGAFHAKGASLRLGRLFVALKLNGNFPGNREATGLPTVQGTILLCDGEDGSVLAIMDSIEVTLRRTAAATALAARHLARPESATVLICGCGEQGSAQLAALREVLPIRRGFAWDRDAGRARAFAEEAGFAVASDLASAALGSDVIVACTSAREPYLEAGFVRPGTFVAAVGADSPGKSEIEPRLMASALVVADSIGQCAAMGDLRLALESGALRREQVHGELGEVVVGAKPGRTDEAQITLFDSTGTALQDVASAALIYQRAKAGGGFASVALGLAR
ncbi:MAG TPA: ornithine cyclodeaminase family protein [Allosphingosinicella sp.]|nr:ornithine cyclodeaminase family protein [Allosphingosinicella sp.]